MEPQHSGAFVQTFPGGIINGGAEERVLVNISGQGEEAVTSGDQEDEEGELGEVRVGEAGGEGVGLSMHG